MISILHNTPIRSLESVVQTPSSLPNAQGGKPHVSGNLSESTVAPPLKEQQTQIGDKCIAARSQAGEMAAKTGQMPAHAENATALAQTTENISKQILTAARKVETTSKGQAERKAGQKMENNAKSAYSSSNSKPASGAILDQAV